ncbi:aconitase family protein, partial [Bordetella pertussis]
GDEAALAAFRALRSDAGARYESERAITLELQAPQMTWGVNPAQVVDVHEPLPDPAAADAGERAAMQQAYDYMGLRACRCSGRSSVHAPTAGCPTCKPPRRWRAAGAWPPA